MLVIWGHGAPGSCGISLLSCLPCASRNTQKQPFGGEGGRSLPGRGQAVCSLACACLISRQAGYPDPQLLLQRPHEW